MIPKEQEKCQELNGAWKLRTKLVISTILKSQLNTYGLQYDKIKSATAFYDF